MDEQDTLPRVIKHLLTHVLVSKYADHQSLYRQNQIFQRAGIDIPRSTLADWVGRCGVELAPLVEALKTAIISQSVLHADETPVKMLVPGEKKAKKAYVWAFATTRWSDVQAVVYDFQPTRAGEVARALVRYLESGDLPIDKNWVENQIRPWALGRSNWLFAGSLRSGQPAANVMTLIQCAKINGLDPQHI